MVGTYNSDRINISVLSTSL